MEFDLCNNFRSLGLFSDPAAFREDNKNNNSSSNDNNNGDGGSRQSESLARWGWSTPRNSVTAANVNRNTTARPTTTPAELEPPSANRNLYVEVSTDTLSPWSTLRPIPTPATSSSSSLLLSTLSPQPASPVYSQPRSSHHGKSRWSSGDSSLDSPAVQRPTYHYQSSQSPASATRPFFGDKFASERRGGYGPIGHGRQGNNKGQELDGEADHPAQVDNFERNVRWLINANLHPPPPARLSAPSSTCRRSNRRPVLGGASTHLLTGDTSFQQAQPAAPARPNAGHRFTPRHQSGGSAVMCALCKKNGEMPEVYNTHRLKDCWGRVVCPVLRAYVCPNCGVSGDTAHTLSYCPFK